MVELVSPLQHRLEALAQRHRSTEHATVTIREMPVGGLMQLAGWGDDFPGGRRRGPLTDGL